MAHPVLSSDDFRALEQTRQRLHQLTNNIASLKQDVVQILPLPEWHSLQASAMILASNIQALTTHLSKHADLLNRTVVYPSTNYPGRTQEGLLGQLLRKKLEPGVESWEEKGKEDGEIMDDQAEEELRFWAADWIAARVAKYALEEAGDEFTVEERESGVDSIRTGLKEEENTHQSEIRKFGLIEVKNHGSQARSTNELLRVSTQGIFPIVTPL
ncbi:RNA polymerase II mediator complex component [Blumeria hordei DH14]|uniref:Mediator of RNA polymerase II transcription subunit 8 n=1 Tax=Blumeria graminis f. sp. hordei (strain DH14) TaxID=546991 RepID=N1JJE4_BLUG1|nr:RNA polymerase II mediator complex component [Blumeria hordei DH14]